MNMADPGAEPSGEAPTQPIDAEPTKAPAPSSIHSHGPTPSPAPAPSAQPTRPLYVPQFTAATEMILKRVKTEPSGLSAALTQASRTPSVTASIPPATYEDVKRRLVSGMNTSTQTTMHMPAPAPAPVLSVRPLSTPTTLPALKPASSTSGMSAIRKVTAGLTASSRPTPIKPTSAKAVSSETKATRKIRITTTTGKRKRPKTEQDDDAAASTSTPSIASTPSSSLSPSPTSTPHPTPSTTFPLPLAPSTAPTPLTMTKSGRHVLKPESYNPAAMEAATKRARLLLSSASSSSHPGSNRQPRTAEQALCRRCLRLHSPAANQIVFCDGCNDGWHQLCHEPRIGEEVVRERGKSWFCAGCVVKRKGVGLGREQGQGGGKKQQLVQQQQQQQQSVGEGGGGGGGGGKRSREGAIVRESWAHRPPQAKRAYLLTLPQPELVALLMGCLERDPELPLFPALHAAPSSFSSSAAQVQSSVSHADANRHSPTGQAGPAKKGAAGGSNGGKGVAAGKGRTASGSKGSQKEDSQERAGEKEEPGEDDEEFDPLVALWPRAGMGLYARLLPDVEDDARLRDDADFEAFSVIVFDDRGRKVEENGMRV